MTALTGIVATTGVAHAATVTYTTAYDAPTDGTVPYAGFGYTDIIDAPLSIQKFDSSLGTLNSVTIDFIGDLKGDAGFENKSPQSSTVTVDLSGTLKLQLPDGTSVVELNPQQDYSYNVTGYDDTTDYAGTSGKTVEGLTASQSDTKTYTDSNSLQTFTGSDDLDLLFSATAKSTVSGSGNIFSYVTTYAKSSIQVTYDYQERKKVPEPSAILGLGFVTGVGLWSQRKRIEARMRHS
ncbi:choice-of-anchor E domain-containing protein [Mastigocladopsis repens]|uniref:choice-of-anchor E domain-containing protein n=1 Tax=Mastigocladopsis repens TaxID=221287 RepID=UPI001E5032F6|nr:PEP-CTERM sorting domain-containing protein [Mastigocladopsis repens]